MADYGKRVELSQYSNLACGGRLSKNEVLLIDLQALLD